MRNTADIFYPIRQIISYIQEIIVQLCFSSGPSSVRSYQIFESKRYRSTGLHSSKPISSDIVPFFAICAFFVVLICLMSKQTKESNDEDAEEEEEEGNERISSMPTINATITESSASSVCSIPIDSKDSTIDTCSDCDDLSPNKRINELIPALNFSIRDHSFRSPPDIQNSTRSSSYTSALSVDHESLRDQQVQIKRCNNEKRMYSKTKQKKAIYHHHQNRIATCLDREWFVKRTRSGQIYGTYTF